MLKYGFDAHMGQKVGEIHFSFNMKFIYQLLTAGVHD